MKKILLTLGTIAALLSILFLLQLNRGGIPNFGVVVKKHLTRSGQPDIAGFRHLRKAGVSVVLKLDTDGEFSNALEKKYFGGRVKFGYVSTDHTIDPYYCEEAIQLADWIQLQIEKGKWVHVHCWMGRDRVGVVVGTWMIRHGGYTFKDVQNTWSQYGTPFVAYQACLKKVTPIVKYIQ